MLMIWSHLRLVKDQLLQRLWATVSWLQIPQHWTALLQRTGISAFTDVALQVLDFPF